MYLFDDWQESRFSFEDIYLRDGGGLYGSEPTTSLMLAQNAAAGHWMSAHFSAEVPNETGSGLAMVPRHVFGDVDSHLISEWTRGNDHEPVADAPVVAKPRLPLSSDNEGDAIVVVGYREAPWIDGWSVGEYTESTVSPEPGETSYVATSDEDAVTVSKHSSVGPLTAEQLAAVETLMKSYYEWVNFLRSIPPETLIRSQDGSVTTAGEALRIWSHTDFVLYPAG